MLTLSIQNLSVHFSGNHVINDVSATLHGGEMVAVVGRNGVGKTTLCGLLIQYLCDLRQTAWRCFNLKIA